jgi:hypothetical protein
VAAEIVTIRTCWIHPDSYGVRCVDFREALDFEEAIQRAVRKVPPQRVIPLSSAANSVASSPVAVLSRASTAEAPGSEVLNVGDHIRYASEVCHADAVTDSGLETL